MADVALIHQPGLRYPAKPPFDPPNPVYTAVEQLFMALGWDRARQGSRSWNPLSQLIRPGDRVVLKPNLVGTRHLHQELRGERFTTAVPHASVLRPLIDWAWRALEGRGSLVVVDAPIEGTDFGEVAERNGLSAMIETLRSRDGIGVELIDLRSTRVVRRMLCDNLSLWGRSLNLGVLWQHPLPGDPRGYTVIDLKDQSYFRELADQAGRFRFHKSHARTPIAHHTAGRNEYSIARSILEADVVISVPKLKTHKKVGVSLSLKNSIGITNRKYWLPHYRAGAPPHGDEYPVTPRWHERIALACSRLPLPGDHSLIARWPRHEGSHEPLSEGDWSGNDTLWRLIVDLNRILQYADKNGQMQPSRQRRFLAVIDGIVGGEGTGPLDATPTRTGLLLASTDPVALDLVGTTLMGFNPGKVRYLAGLRSDDPYPLGTKDLGQIHLVPEDVGPLNLKFRPPRGWDDLVRTAADEETPDG